MAKKNSTPKKGKTTVITSEAVKEVQLETDVFETEEHCFSGELLCTPDDVQELFISTPKKSSIEYMNVSDLIWVEKACAIVCKKYETTARLDLENNKKLSEFSNYYKNILNELEDRVRKVCMLPE